MSIAEKKLTLSRAAQLAANLVGDLESSCERIEVAGSIRRKKPEVGDIEIVAVPRIESNGQNLYGEGFEVRPIDDALSAMVERGYLGVLKGFKPGQKWKAAQFRIKHVGCNLDLYLADGDNFGWILMLRTGPENFSHNLVKQRKHGGYLPGHLQCKGGRLLDSDGKPILKARAGRVAFWVEEQHVFEALGMEFIAPEKRA